MKKIRFIFALWVGRLAKFVIGIIAPGRGTSKPGIIALKLDPDFISHFSGIDPDKILYVTGTNGKSTTTNLIHTITEKAGIRTATNLEGANLIDGVAVSLMENSTLGGRFLGDWIIMETDERYLPVISRQLPPKWLCVTNLQKDQVQRNGEPDIIYRKISSAIRPGMTLFLNNEEPISRNLANQAERAVYYGVAQSATSFRKEETYHVTVPCPVCSAPIEFSYYNIDNVGPFRCTHCGYASEERPEYFVENIDGAHDTFEMNGTVYHMPYDAPYFLYCYAAALAVTREMGVSAEVTAEALKDFVNVGGRFESFEYGGKTIRYLRMKQENPETVQSALDYIAQDPEPKIFMLGLNEIVDFKPYYTNTFYTYDCDFDRLRDANVESCICFSAVVAWDAANRLHYAGVPKEKIRVLATNDDETILKALDQYSCRNVYMITWLHKFESMKKYVTEHGGARAGRASD